MSTTPESSAPSASAYDVVPYPSASFPQSHPGRLAAMGRLFGLNPPAPCSARVLELGCADGANLLPMADVMPGATFVGIDASKVQIEAGDRALAAAGLKNVELRCQDILEFAATEGKFDYIIAHGIFSWVPDPVREKVLAICSSHLTDNGIVYISYNALPGWNMRRSLREMIRFHTKSLKDSVTQVQQARALVKFMADAVPTENNAYGLLLRSELEGMASQPDGFLIHDIMEDENTAFYFHDFVAWAGRHGLQYLSEPSLASMLATNFPPAVRETLGRIGAGVVAQEQYMDFLRNRFFRQTLLCRAGLTVQRNIPVERIKQFSFQSLLKPIERKIDLRPGIDVEFRSVNGMQIISKDSFVKAMLMAFSETSGVLDYAELLRITRERSRPMLDEVLANRDQTEETLLAGNLMDLYTKGVLELWAEPVALAAKMPERPAVSALVRHQALTARYLTNRLHQPIPADNVVRQLLIACDGTRTFDELVAYVVDLAVSGKLQMKQGDQVITSRERLIEVVRLFTESLVQQLLRLGLIKP